MFFYPVFLRVFLDNDRNFTFAAVLVVYTVKMLFFKLITTNERVVLVSYFFLFYGIPNDAYFFL